ncbi:MAG: ABC transporter ATP-binding protein [Chloroflexi bacterium]|nr:ABC transporter ATP-binding protein [Chloroflexota bacterium]
MTRSCEPHGPETSREAEMEQQALKVTNVSKYFGGGFDYRKLVSWCLPVTASRPPVTQVLQDVSFEVRRGEIFGLIGANGSGKSTLVRVLSTLLLPDSGSVEVFGHDVVSASGSVRALINRVSADPSFFRNMSSYENLLFFGRIYGLSPAEIRVLVPDVLRRLGFKEEMASEPMSHLSRGQQQKVAVARSFLTSPVLMLLDEPTTGLDPRSRRDVQRFIRDVQREHDVTILLTTHDMEEAEVLCDRISFIAGGRIVASGTPLELRQRVARGRPVEEIDMEDVFMELTGRDLEEDEAPAEVTTHG